MFGLGLGEIAIILVVALIVFGPDKLPEMAKQAASFVRDMRKMVANARRDISVSIEDLGIDEEDLRTLRQLRNPKAFVRDKVLDGIDLDDLGLDDVSLDGKSSAKANGTSKALGAAKANGGHRPSTDNATPAETAAPAGSHPDLPYDPDTT
ncbi:MAG TPA: twin-arginine translocase TatA/TatE family subunit [Jiangellaceae bacterium]|nr:twin-arginine translocase TatA/TatE family subunit [Jiangellaceae bacterium]